MTQLTDPSASSSRSSESKTANTTIHNHFTKGSDTILDLSPVMKALNAFMLSTRQCAYPQLVVTCRGQKVAFSRASLADMTHKRATDLFIQRFARSEDWLDVPRSSSWFPQGGRCPPEVECLATFCRAEEESGLVELDPSGWSDNIKNVRELTVILTRKVAIPES
ncbi:hypothetical protein MSAN_01632600 [Mycena sanguinolenta]|uniref:Uncharacterized protein n=1 Tax=Mycena sanguinolenta TaxID=230812 RepID=A0A8H6Y1Y1_9AGAR|nr:hypothetical protein MSAN_01632600 [Mycena sanguinolenta]